MINNKSVIAIIPARAGSKGLPQKNIKKLFGKELIGWSIEQARNSRYIDNIFVSTDSDEIAKISKKFGIEVPFFRPKIFAQDNSPTSDAILYTLNKLEKVNRNYDYLVLLEPTSPLRKRSDIDRGIELFHDDKYAKTLVSVGHVLLEHPKLIKTLNGKYLESYLNFETNVYQRQQLEDVFFPYGVMYLSDISYYKKHQTFYSDKTIPLFIERWQNFEIDDIIDFKIVEKLFEMKLEVING